MREYVSSREMLDFLQDEFTKALDEKKRFGNDERANERISRVIWQKELVEALIGEPVNLQHDGKVTVDF